MKKLFLISILFCLFAFQTEAEIPDSIKSSIEDNLDYSNSIELFNYTEYLIGNYELNAGFACLKELKKRFTKDNNQYYLAKVMYNFGDYYYLKNEYDSASIAYSQTLPMAIVQQDTFLIAKTYNSIGLIHAYKGEKQLALQNYLNEINLIEEVKNPSSDLKNEKLVVLINIIGLYVAHDEAKNIIKYAKTAIELGKELKDSIRLGSAYNLLGVGYRYNKEYDLAKEAFDKSITIFQALNDNYYLSFLYLNYGTLYEYLSELDTAIDYYQKGLNGFLRDEYYYGVMSALNNLGHIYYLKNDYEQSRKYLLQIFDLNIENSFPQKMIHSYQYLSETEFALGNYKEAFEYQKQYITLLDSLKNKEKMEKYTELQTKFETIQKDYKINILETEKIENELELRKSRLQKYIGLSTIFILIISGIFVLINLQNKRIANQELLSKNIKIESQNDKLYTFNQRLNKLNQELKESQKDLSYSNKTKDRFISILAHDLRNPLHNIMGQSFLLSNSYSKLDPQNRIKFAKDINVSTNHVNRLLDNLLEWARTQAKKIEFSPKIFDLNNVVQNVETVLNGLASEKNIRIVNNVPHALTVYADQAMIETIIRNIVSNSIKFTNQNGKITIDAACIGNEIITSVTDNGIGISDDDSQKIFHLDHNLKTKGTNNESGTGLGLIICKEFIDIHQGKIWVESKLGEGTKFSFTIPIPEA